MQNIELQRAGLIKALTFEHQADATLNQANPVSGTQYEVLAATNNVRIIGVSVVCTWTVQPDPIEIWIVIDGQTLQFYFNSPVSATAYSAIFRSDAAANYMTTSAAADPEQNRAFLLEGRNVQVLAEITGGTVQNLSCRVKYALRD